MIVQGAEVVPCKYDEAFSFSNGLAKVLNKGMAGFIDKTGKIIIALYYAFAGKFCDGSPCAMQNPDGDLLIEMVKK